MRYSPALVLVAVGLCTGLACAPAPPPFDPEIPELPALPAGLDETYFLVPEDNPMTKS